ncbi:MAG: cytochrome c biogenesis protein DipZ [Collimonas pratensis]|uniref:cytochrome c biogenesis protein DipZ n=1 Tax=Collimonas pratensis TaxID=279113 RepID=UPI003C751849
MLFLVLAYLGGVLTILSPCILPVLPFVFARSDQPFLRSGLPLLLGMIAAFGATATLAAVGGGWAVQANQYGRWAAIVLLALFGATLLFPQLSDRLTRPLVAAGGWLSQRASGAEGGGARMLSSFLLGIATGMLWAPCAGPILGLVLTGAALQGASVKTTILLLAYAAGAASSLAAALLIGGRIFGAMKRSLGASEWIRKLLGIAVLGGVVAIALGLDTGILARLSSSRTNNVEQSLLGRFGASGSGAAQLSALPADAAADSRAIGDLPVEGELPSLNGAVEWLNSPPLTAAGLRGKVVLVDFWTYSCINCLRSLPYIRAWADKYRDQGLVVIGVHAPEFAFEKNVANVKTAVSDLGITYPVAVDNDYAIWRAFNNQYWPAHYFIDAQGKIRYHHFGEGEYAQSERVIQQLLAEAGHAGVTHDIVNAHAEGAQLQADTAQMQSPETYVGYARASDFSSEGGQVHDRAHAYVLPSSLALNQWGLGGNWQVKGEKAVLDSGVGRIAYRFHARDLHLVLGPGAQGKPVHFRILIDGQPPGADHGSDVDAQGEGTVTEERLYQLIRQKDASADHLFEIEFLSPGAEAFAFTFG